MILEVREGQYEDDLECTSGDKCAKCQGDCDSDDDCTGTLRCFMRYSGEHVPGCEETNAVDPRTDFCYDPTDAIGTAEGNCDDYPCKACQGECEGHNQCEGRLRCMERSGTEAVPGCGALQSSTIALNMCMPFEAERELRFLGFSACSSNSKCDKCRGDCDTDADCVGDFKCKQRSSSNTDEQNAVPGCYVEHKDSINDSMDFCYNPDDEN